MNGPITTSANHFHAHIRPQGLRHHHAPVGLLKILEIATQVRPTASPLPFSVWTYSAFFPDFARIDARRA